MVLGWCGGVYFGRGVGRRDGGVNTVLVQCEEGTEKKLATHAAQKTFLRVRLMDGQVPVTESI